MPTLTLIGFVYGIWPGFLIAGIASMLGAGIAFLSVRVCWFSAQRWPPANAVLVIFPGLVQKE